MHLKEQEWENKTVLSDGGEKWCAVSGKDGEGFSSWRPQYSEDDLLIGTEYNLHATVGTSWFGLVLSFILNIHFNFFPWLGCYLLRHTCGVMVSSVSCELCSHRPCACFYPCSFSNMSNWSIDLSGLHAILFCVPFSKSYSTLCLQCHGRCLPCSGCSLNVSWDQQYINK